MQEYNIVFQERSATQTSTFQSKKSVSDIKALEL